MASQEAIAVIARAVLLLGALAGVAGAYPIDAYEETGIARLEGYRLAQQGEVEGAIMLPRGALWTKDRIKLKLIDRPGFELPGPDADLGAQLTSMLGDNAPQYGVAVLDLSDIEHPRYAEHNGDMVQNPGSVGKVMVLLAVFQALADLHPDDLEARRRVLRDTVLVADPLIRSDTHTVPFWQPGDRRLVRRALAEGDRGNLWTYLDWMSSSSSNGAASMVMAELVLMRHFGKRYPMPRAEGDAFLKRTPKNKLRDLLVAALTQPAGRSGLANGKLRQGSLFTREGKRRIPGTNSVATSRELMRYLLHMEQGKLVDRFSSEEIKRLLYLTEPRIRYAASSALYDAAVFFKSGTLMQCRPERGFTCKKYEANVANYMNSIAVIETEAELKTKPLHYIAVVLSNVLRKNSALAHEAFAARIHAMIAQAHRK